ncbi:MAG: hypothetical protein EOP90_05615 [Lysobacteraceae bacterium]|nr:MAG: hypothetical protein EOP90_05615 [Xanthomonadaceae bacterium]
MSATDLLARLRAQVGGSRDGALLRFSIGNALLGAGDTVAAAEAFREAIAFDSAYSAAWKLLGRALLEAGERAQAASAWQHGVQAAQARGDVQAAKEMQVFLRRLGKTGGT